jgi:hypothetical protein
MLAFTIFNNILPDSREEAPTWHQLEQRGDKATPARGIMMQFGCLDVSWLGLGSGSDLGIDGISR